MDWPTVVKGRLYDSPRSLDDVLTCEATERPVQRIAEQTLVGVLALTERSGEVNIDVDLLAVHVGARRLGLQCEGDTITLAEPQPDQVAARWRATGFVEQHARW